MQKVSEIWSHIVANLRIRRELNRVMCCKNFVFVKFKIAYKLVYRKRYGLDMDSRKKNEIRRALNFAGVTRFCAIEDDKKQYLTKFLEATHLAFGTSTAFTNFIRNLIKVQNIRTYINETRDCRFQLMYKRLKEQAEFLIQFYTKKGKKNKRGPKIIKNLKKLFDPKRIEDFRLVQN
jgi:hypothetical protein